MSKKPQTKPEATQPLATLRELLRGNVEQAIGPLEAAIAEAELCMGKPGFDKDISLAVAAARSLGARVEALSDRLKTLAHKAERYEIAAARRKREGSKRD